MWKGIVNPLSGLGNFCSQHLYKYVTFDRHINPSMNWSLSTVHVSYLLGENILVVVLNIQDI